MKDPIKDSGLVLVLCSIVIIYVVCQALFFMKKAWNRGKELNMSEAAMKKIIVNGVLVSIVPSLPIVISLLVLMQGLGQFFPWLRLSILGSATYETIVASNTAKAFGLSGISDPLFAGDIFISAMWAMTIAIMGGLIVDVFFLNPIDKKMKAAQKGKNAQFIPIALSALFPALISVFCVPQLFDFEKISGIVAFVASGITVLILAVLAKTLKLKALNEFSMSISMIVGMAVVILIGLQ